MEIKSKKSPAVRNKWPIFAALIISVIGVGVMCIAALLPAFNDRSGRLDAELSSLYGTFVGGVAGPLLSLAVFFLIYQTIRDQRTAFVAQQIEGRLFHLLQRYETGVLSMKHRPSTRPSTNKVSGREVFMEFRKQCIELLGHVSEELTDRPENECINIAYLLFFYGVSERTLETTKSMLGPYLTPDELQALIEKVRRQRAVYNKKVMRYGGHQSNLSNYYRQMFHIVRYIDEAPLPFAQKYGYARLLRSLLSNYEQALLFFNSLSSIGAPWRDNGWIARYNLIKNIPKGFLSPIDPKAYYPKIQFEYEERSGSSSTT